MYLNDWKDVGFLGMVADFEGIDIKHKSEMDAALKHERWQGMEVLLASYGTEDFSGDAFVLFRKDGKLYEVNGSHCSCYGLEDQSYSGERHTQWEPEETTIEALRHRLDNGKLGQCYSGNEYANELRSVLGSLELNNES